MNTLSPSLKALLFCSLLAYFGTAFVTLHLSPAYWTADDWQMFLYLNLLTLALLIKKDIDHD